MLDHVMEKKLNDDDVNSIGWLVIEVIKGGDEAAIKAKQSALVKRFVDTISTPSYPKSAEIAKQLNTLLEGTDKVDTGRLETIDTMVSHHAGWRHDNDKVDFREVQIYPTLEEIACQDAPYLPQTDVVFKTSSSGQSSTAQYLNWCFRLLREDIVSSVIEEINLILQENTSTGKATGKFKRPAIGVKIAQVVCNQNSGVAIRVEFQHPQRLTAKLNRQNNKTKVIEDFYQEHSKFLKQGILVAFIEDSNSLLGLGVVSNRDIENLKKNTT